MHQSQHEFQVSSQPSCSSARRTVLGVVIACGLALPLGATQLALAQDKQPAPPRGATPRATPVPNKPQPVMPTTQPVTVNPNVPPQPNAGPGNVAPTGTQDPAPTTPMPVQITAENFRFGPFAEPVEVKLIADLIASRLNIQIMATDMAVRDKKVLLLTPVDVPKDQLLNFLNLLLSQNGQAMIRDTAGVYIIRPSNELEGRFGTDAFSPTRIIPTPGLRPSSLQQAINLVTQGGGAAGAPAAAGRLAFLDDLGFIIMTDTPRKISAVIELVEQLSKEQASVHFTRFELKHISAPTARQRILEQLGRIQQRSSINPGDPNAALAAQQQAAANAGGGGGASIGSITNISERLAIDPQGNALSFRGRPDEQELLTRLLAIIDVNNTLQGKWYPIGSAAQQVAQQAKRLGLGDTITLATGGSGDTNRAFLPGQAAQGGFGGAGGAGGGSDLGGSVFVLDSQGRGFMYYGTAEQQERVERLVVEFAPLTELETVVYEFYKLRHSDAEKVGQVVQGLLSNSVPTGSSPLLPGGGRGATPMGRRVDTRNAARQNNDLGQTAFAGNENAAIESSDDVFVLADKENNQIVVKAPRRLQAQFKNLIERLDLRRAQVYIEAQIIVLTDNDTLRLAFDQQLIALGGQSFAARSIFSAATSLAAGGTILSRPSVIPVAPGFTAAIIKSDSVPLVITALATSNAGKVAASPRLLVDDNEEATIESRNSVPTQTQTQVGGGTGQTLTGFGGFEDAGPKLTVKPQISAGDYLRLKYDLELSNFTGEGGNGLPPPKTRTNVKSDSVTVPSDSTIILGGLSLENNTRTVFKVPLLGDIPIFGQLFRDERTSNQKSTVYVFLTPRIMRDNTFDDLRLLSKGPAAAAKLVDDMPPIKPVAIEVLTPPRPRDNDAGTGLPAPKPSPSSGQESVSVGPTSIR